VPRVLKKQLVKELPRLRKRFRRGRKPYYEVTCSCGAYHYPHRFGSGWCSGSALVNFFWEKGMCGSCRHIGYDDWNRCPVCQVLEGREKDVECEQLQEFLQSTEGYTKRLSKR